MTIQSTQLEATITQFAVGQGGFLVGRIVKKNGNNSREFTYAFDCGSINREHFQQGLDACPVTRLDVLFVSHLDLDHVNGIDALAAKVQIDAVVIPCLDELHTTIVAAEYIEKVGVNESIVELLRNPAKWFGERGVKKVYFQSRDNSMDDFLMQENQDRQDLNEDNPGNNFQDNGRLPYQIEASRINRKKQVKTTKGVVEQVILGGAVKVKVGTPKYLNEPRAPVWILVPFVHLFSKVSLDAFTKAASDVLNIKPRSEVLPKRDFIKQLLSALRDETSRKKLKACYALLSSDNNKPSMSLYSGLARLSHYKEISISINDLSHTPQKYHPQNPQKQYAWLSTGDANLESDETKSVWLKKYGPLLSSVAVFVLPHHGSNRHIHDDVINGVLDAAIVACAATNRPKHPHPTLRQRLKIRHADIFQVSEFPESSITFKVTLCI